jgi:PAS domain S-box-containing protein
LNAIYDSKHLKKMVIKQDVFPSGELEGVLDKALADLQRLNDQIERNEWELLRLKVRSVAEVFSAFSADGVLFVSPRGRILYADKRIEQMFGYSADELAKQQVEMLIPPEVRESHSQPREDSMVAKSRPMVAGIALGSRGLKKDGTEFKIGISLNPGQVDGECVFCLICTAPE